MKIDGERADATLPIHAPTPFIGIDRNSSDHASRGKQGCEDENKPVFRDVSRKRRRELIASRIEMLTSR